MSSQSWMNVDQAADMSKQVEQILANTQMRESKIWIDGNATSGQPSTLNLGCMVKTTRAPVGADRSQTNILVFNFHFGSPGGWLLGSYLGKSPKQHFYPFPKV